jgi:phage I-like protein
MEIWDLEDTNTIHALASVLPEGDPPTSIQFLPPGKHSIRAHKSGKPVDLTVIVDESVANRLQSSAKAIVDNGQEMFIDFDHEDKGASAWVQKLYWAGDDPKTGGVRADVQWTSAGQAALKGKSYKRFSPTFTTNEKGEIDGTRANAGGLVNRPAFTSIEKIVAKAGDLEASDAATKEQEKQMEIKELEAALQAKDAEIAVLKKSVEDFTAKQAADKASRIKSLIQAACADGRIAAKDEAKINVWTGLLENEGAETILASLPKLDVDGNVVGGKPAGKSADKADLTDPEARMEAQRKAIAVIQAKGVPFQAAYEAAKASEPDLFKAIEE